MNYSIIGSGAIGSALATHFAANGVDVLLANSRGPSSFQKLVRGLGPNVIPASVPEALRADMVILAIPFPAVPNAVSGIDDWRGRIVVDPHERHRFTFVHADRPQGTAIKRNSGGDGSGGTRGEGVQHSVGGGVATNPVVGGGRRVISRPQKMLMRVLPSPRCAINSASIRSTLGILTAACAKLRVHG